jgi:hypothetical protein
VSHTNNLQVGGKTSNLKRQIKGGMSDDKLAELHEFLKDPIRQKILLKLGEYDSLTFEELLEKLKIDDSQELLRQLKVLDDLVKVTEDSYSLTEEGVSKKPSGRYMLTERGHDAIEEMIDFPELESENYKKFFGKSGLAQRKLAYIIIGAFFGFILSILTAKLCVTSLLSTWLNEPWPSMPNSGPKSAYDSSNWTFFILVIFVAPIIGALFGYGVGKLRNFKRPMPEWN